MSAVACSISLHALLSVLMLQQVVERSLLPDGRQLVMNIGRERFKLLRVLQEKPYMVGVHALSVNCFVAYNMAWRIYM